MAKDLKLNIKNAQIAQALKKFNKKPTPIKKAKPKQKEKDVREPTTIKRKARILPPEEKEKKPTEEEKKEAEKSKTVKKTIEKELLEKEVKETDEIKLTKEEPVAEKPAIKEEKPAKEKEETKPNVLAAKTAEEEAKKKPKSYKDFKAAKKPQTFRAFDTRDRLGLRSYEDERWRKRRYFKSKKIKSSIEVLRPKSLKVIIPITIKDLASAMKLKASELIRKLFLQGITLTINDYLNDETTIQLLGHEFDCEISIDVEEEKRLQITDLTIKEEISNTPKEDLTTRPAVITFMGHVDHGKTSLIDAIRLSNLANQEAGQITQHIGAFTAKTKFGPITILDTPGHEAFTAMRSRGANVTDIIVLVIAGDEGIRDQTIEAIKQAKDANVPMVVAINKSDKVGFDQEKIYRSLADRELLPEAWGGTVITINCSAKTKEGVDELLEMLSLQAEILELRADPKARARGTILESEMHKGLGAAATVLVQNGTLKTSDAIVFSDKYGRIKTLHDQFDNIVDSAGPSMPVMITGLSSLAEAGSEFVVVENEKIAKDLADARKEKMKLKSLQKAKPFSLESLEKKEKKTLPIILRADVQGSLEALKTSLLNIKSDKAELSIVSAEVGEISESDIRLASASKSVILGFHTKIESHAESLIKQLKVIILQHNIIYHAIDEIKELMKSTLDKLEEFNDIGKAKVIAVFKSSHLGLIAGCLITDGIVKRNSFVRIIRDGKEITKTKISSLKREKEDVKEVNKGLECGIVLENFSDVQNEDIFEAYDITYIEQEL
ncbi:MAG: Translation initiation factor IF-2 [Candidatus Anoxychlamydiales bacterium]|nr:Translation initiation factor IF-2 [Candidatus Anoxychlamydiales bacterium]